MDSLQPRGSGQTCQAAVGLQKAESNLVKIPAPHERRGKLAIRVQIPAAAPVFKGMTFLEM